VSIALALAAALLERVRDVFQEQQPQHQVLVLVLGRLDGPRSLFAASNSAAPFGPSPAFSLICQNTV
jgi:hypothetical protein